MSDHKRKLIEVALPLDEINTACKADKDRKSGTLRGLHKWFAPMPLPAWRALLFASLVDDPSSDENRAYLLDVIKRLVVNGADMADERTLQEAQGILAEQFPDGVPTVFDPFCGGGSTLVEAQRLGLPTFGTDLNPVPVLITRTVTDLLPGVHGQQPVNPEPASGKKRSGVTSGRQGSLLPRAAGTKSYSGYAGLARDLAFYAEVIQSGVATALAAHYPQEPDETVVSWMWCRTATCPNPVCNVETLLLTSMVLSRRRHDYAWIEPVVEGKSVSVTVRSNMAHDGTPISPKIGDGVFACIACGGTLDGTYLRSEGKAGRLGLRMTAIVAERHGQRSYRAATDTDLRAAAHVPGEAGFAAVPLNGGGQGIRVGLYGIDSWDRMFTPRQLLVLDHVADAIADLQGRLTLDGASVAWTEAIMTLLGLALGRMAQHQSTQVRWKIDSRTGQGQAFPAFARHDLPMQWDFVEPSPMHGLGSLVGAVRSIAMSLGQVGAGRGQVVRADARTVRAPAPSLVATDPPYFDAIGYADLSDYFYIWHRRALRSVHPDLYATLAAPKIGELTAVPAHHGNSKDKARSYFISGFTDTFSNLQESMAPGLPMLIVYASKEQKANEHEETRWSSILTAMMDAGLEITGTWPIHGTGTNRMVGQGTNAVATYVVMVCRPRPTTAGNCSLGDFNRALRRELKPAVHAFQSAGILPVDLAQAAMGPGMQTYSRYRAVLDQDGKRVAVEVALRLINAALGEVLDEQEGELDPYSRFAVAWWERHGWGSAQFGIADQLARPQGTSVDDIVRSGVACYPKAGFVSLLGRGEMDREWTPVTDSRPTAWEAVHHLADRLIDGGGAVQAGRLMGELDTFRDPTQALVYRLHDIAARKGWTKDQERYNALIGSWSDLIALSSAAEKDGLF